MVEPFARPSGMAMVLMTAPPRKLLHDGLFECPKYDRFLLPLRSLPVAPHLPSVPRIVLVFLVGCSVWPLFGGRLRPRCVFSFINHVNEFDGHNDDTVPPCEFHSSRQPRLLFDDPPPPLMLTIGWLLCWLLYKIRSSTKGTSFGAFLFDLSGFLKGFLCKRNGVPSI